jgi:predicted nucleic acid-binding Zn ribbon protein
VEDIVGKIKASLANIEGIEAEIRKIEEERAAADAAAKAAAEARSATIVVPPMLPAEPAQQSYAAQAPVYAAQPVEAQSAPAEFHTSTPVQGEYSFGAPVQPVQPAPATPAASALKCANCGAALNPGTKFCQECGTPAPAPAKRFCPNCGKELPPEVRFCPECGTKA